MAVHSLGAYQTKIYQFIFGLVIVALGFLAVRRMIAGTVKSGQMIAALILGVIAMLVLDRRYWLLMPILGGFGMKVPGLPFSGGELGQIAVVGIHFLRLGLHRDSPAKLDERTWPVVPVFFWIAGIFCLNPAGLAMFGSATIGSRFYGQIALGFCFFFALSAQRLNESDCKILFRIMVAAAAFRLCREIVIPPSDPDAIVAIGDVPERNSRYALIGFGTLYAYVFARHELASILRSLPLLATTVLLALMTTASGKRQAFGRLLIVPWISAFLRAKGRGLTILCSFIGLVLALFAIAGDGAFYTLPKSATRSLAILAPQKYFSGSSTVGAKDFFREQMRKQARIVIAEHPFVGRKGFAMDLETTAWGLGGRFGRYEGHAYTGNWHSTWYAFAADFGIPCMLLFAWFFLKATAFEIRQCRLIRPDTFAFVLMVFYATETLCTLAFSYTSGHSAMSFSKLCENYGWAIAIASSAFHQGISRYKMSLS